MASKFRNCQSLLLSITDENRSLYRDLHDNSARISELETFSNQLRQTVIDQFQATNSSHLLASLQQTLVTPTSSASTSTPETAGTDGTPARMVNSNIETERSNETNPSKTKNSNNNRPNLWHPMQRSETETVSTTSRRSERLEKFQTLFSRLIESDIDPNSLAQRLFVLSKDPDNCSVMRPTCLPIVFSLLYSPMAVGRSTNNITDVENLASNPVGRATSDEARHLAFATLRNLVLAGPPASVQLELDVLEQIDALRLCVERAWHVFGGVADDRCLDQSESGWIGLINCDPGEKLTALIKWSFEDGYRHSLSGLGVVQAMCDLLLIDHALWPFQAPDLSVVDLVIFVLVCSSSSAYPDCYSLSLRRNIYLVLTNLTFGDLQTKGSLVSHLAHLRCIVADTDLGSQIRGSEELCQFAGSVLRNLSWKADEACKSQFRAVRAIGALTAAVQRVQRDSTLKSLLQALWNLSAHHRDNKKEICAVPGFLEFLCRLLQRPTMGAESNALVVIENTGGILRNCSSEIAVNKSYRQVIRKTGAFETLVDHLRSSHSGLMVNACGTLWNLSARSAEDQERLRVMGAVELFAQLASSSHQQVANASMGVLKNVLGSTEKANRAKEAFAKKIPESSSVSVSLLQSRPTAAVVANGWPVIMDGSGPQTSFQNVSESFSSSPRNGSCASSSNHASRTHSRESSAGPANATPSSSSSSVAAAVVSTVTVSGSSSRARSEDRFTRVLPSRAQVLPHTTIYSSNETFSQPIHQPHQHVQYAQHMAGGMYPVLPKSTSFPVGPCAVNAGVNESPGTGPGRSGPPPGALCACCHHHRVYYFCQSCRQDCRQDHLSATASTTSDNNAASNYHHHTCLSAVPSTLSQMPPQNKSLFPPHFLASPQPQPDVPGYYFQSSPGSGVPGNCTAATVNGTAAIVANDPSDCNDLNDTRESTESRSPSPPSPPAGHFSAGLHHDIMPGDDCLKTYCTENTPSDFLSNATSVVDLPGQSCEPTAGHPAGTVAVSSAAASSLHRQALLRSESTNRRQGVGPADNVESVTTTSQPSAPPRPVDDSSSSDKIHTFCIEDSPMCFSRASGCSSSRSSSASPSGSSNGVGDDDVDGANRKGSADDDRMEISTATDADRTVVTECDEDGTTPDGVATGPTINAAVASGAQNGCGSSTALFGPSTQDRSMSSSPDKALAVDSCDQASRPQTQAQASKPEKTVTFLDHDLVQQTPMMFSRSSSMSSLNSFEAPSVHSSLVSEYSRRASEVVSPSELPDSPSQTMPPSRPNEAVAAISGAAGFMPYPAPYSYSHSHFVFPSGGGSEVAAYPMATSQNRTIQSHNQSHSTLTASATAVSQSAVSNAVEDDDVVDSEVIGISLNAAAHQMRSVPVGDEEIVKEFGSDKTPNTGLSAASSLSALTIDDDDIGLRGLPSPIIEEGGQISVDADKLLASILSDRPNQGRPSASVAAAVATEPLFPNSTSSIPTSRSQKLAAAESNSLFPGTPPRLPSETRQLDDSSTAPMGLAHGRPTAPLLSSTTTDTTGSVGAMQPRRIGSRSSRCSARSNATEHSQMYMMQSSDSDTSQICLIPQKPGAQYARFAGPLTAVGSNSGGAYSSDSDHTTVVFAPGIGVRQNGSGKSSSHTSENETVAVPPVVSGPQSSDMLAVSLEDDACDISDNDEGQALLDRIIQSAMPTNGSGRKKKPNHPDVSRLQRSTAGPHRTKVEKAVTKRLAPSTSVPKPLSAAVPSPSMTVLVGRHQRPSQVQPLLTPNSGSNADPLSKAMHVSNFLASDNGAMGSLAPDVLRVYATDDTPADCSCATSLSGLSLDDKPVTSTVNQPVGGTASAAGHQHDDEDDRCSMLSDSSLDSISGEGDRLLQQAIQSAMPTAPASTGRHHRLTQHTRPVQQTGQRQDSKTTVPPSDLRSLDQRMVEGAENAAPTPYSVAPLLSQTAFMRGSSGGSSSASKKVSGTPNSAGGFQISSSVSTKKKGSPDEKKLRPSGAVVGDKVTSMPAAPGAPVPSTTSSSSTVAPNPSTSSKKIRPMGGQRFTYYSSDVIDGAMPVEGMPLSFSRRSSLSDINDELVAVAEPSPGTQTGSGIAGQSNAKTASSSKRKPPPSAGSAQWKKGGARSKSESRASAMRVIKAGLLSPKGLQPPIGQVHSNSQTSSSKQTLPVHLNVDKSRKSTTKK